MPMIRFLSPVCGTDAEFSRQCATNSAPIMIPKSVAVVMAKNTLR